MITSPLKSTHAASRSPISRQPSARLAICVIPGGHAAGLHRVKHAEGAKEFPGGRRPENSLTAELPLIELDPPSLRRRSPFIERRSGVVHKERSQEHRSETMANNTTITGNLTREPEIRYTKEGQATAQLGVAVNRRWQDRVHPRVDGGDLILRCRVLEGSGRERSPFPLQGHARGRHGSPGAAQLGDGRR